LSKVAKASQSSAFRKVKAVREIDAVAEAVQRPRHCGYILERDARHTCEFGERVGALQRSEAMEALQNPLGLEHNRDANDGCNRPFPAATPPRLPSPLRRPILAGT
jgi:hypothetical protein